MTVTRLVNRDVAVISSHKPLTTFRISLPTTQQEEITDAFKHALYQYTGGKGYTLKTHPEVLRIFCSRRVAGFIKWMLIPNLQTQFYTGGERSELINAEHYA